MMPNKDDTPFFNMRMVAAISAGFFLLGVGAFFYQLGGDHPGAAWQAYLINFILWSAISQGALLFSAVMHLTKARWAGPLSGLAESFVVFFPLSFVLFLLLWFGKAHVFPWQYLDLHGKEVWLNLPFLFSRDCAGLVILYFLGLMYLHYSIPVRLVKDQWEEAEQPRGMIRRRLQW